MKKRLGCAFLTMLNMLLWLSGCINVYDYVDTDLSAEPPAVQASEAVQESSSSRVNGVWIATVYGIDYPSASGLSADELRQQADAIVEDAVACGITDLFLQVRGCSDAIYPSALFPSSSSIVSKQGDPLPMDVLDYFVRIAHAQGLRIHAWINPYRITSPSEKEEVGWGLDRLAETNPARQHEEYVVKHQYQDGDKTMYAMYYDPGLTQTQDLIVAGAEELLKNYELDGLHIDDYFYPYQDAQHFADDASYAANGNGMDRDDWRRSNVDRLVERLGRVAHEHGAVFGVSPSGIWAKQSDQTPQGTPGLGNTLQSYYDVYADSLKWVQNHWVDYICPQIYWQTDHPSAPFRTIADWWNGVCLEAGVDLYVGIAAYRGSESATAFADPDEIARQLAYLNDKQACRGVVYYSYRSLKNNLANVRQSMSVFQIAES